MKIVVKFHLIVCVVWRREQIPILGGGGSKTLPSTHLMNMDFDVVDKLWYITGDEGCGQVRYMTVTCEGYMRNVL